METIFSSAQTTWAAAIGFICGVAAGACVMALAFIAGEKPTDE